MTMSAIVDQQFVERLHFFDGQRLYADDLQAIEIFQREMRQLHNRSLHQPGIGSGLAASGRPGDREVTIGPGYALDFQGREIVHTYTRHEPIPPVQGDDDGNPAAYYLVVSYPSDAELEESEMRAGVCVPPGAVRLTEEPTFCWIRLERTINGFKPADATVAQQIAMGERILLAQITVLDCKLHSLSVGQRRDARPTLQPHIACGRLRPEHWEVKVPDVWIVEQPGPAYFQAVILEATVSTASARFGSTPNYLARIEGPRVVEIEIKVGSDPIRCLAECLASVKEPTRDLFIVEAATLIVSRVRLPRITAEIFTEWEIVWMGIE
jgi:hypothetical protein